MTVEVVPINYLVCQSHANFCYLRIRHSEWVSKALIPRLEGGAIFHPHPPILKVLECVFLITALTLQIGPSCLFLITTHVTRFPQR